MYNQTTTVITCRLHVLINPQHYCNSLLIPSALYNYQHHHCINNYLLTNYILFTHTNIYPIADLRIEERYRNIRILLLKILSEQLVLTLLLLSLLLLLQSLLI